MEELGHIRNRLGVQQYSAHSPHSFILMNFVCSNRDGSKIRRYSKMK
jgi:hypothetical protein